MYALSFIFVSCVAAFILFKFYGRPYPRASKSFNVWFGPLPTHGENQVRYFLRDAMYALAWTAAFFLPVLLLAKMGVQVGYGSEAPMTLQVILAILIGLTYLMFVSLAVCLLKAFFLSLFWRRRTFNETLGKFVTERSYR